MHRSIDLIRWFNHACPWNGHKHALAQWAARRLPVTPDPQVYGGVQGGLRVRLDLANELQRWAYLNVFELVSIQLLRRILRPGDVFVDGGANIGMMTLAAAQRVGSAGRVHAFEPQPEALARLHENIHLNDFQNVTVIPKGCWDRAQKSSIFTYEGGDANLGMASMGRRSDEMVGREIDIETIRIDEAVSGPVRLIKLDIEGAELAALRGADDLFNADPPPHLIIELNPVTARAFGYHPIETVDLALQRHPAYRLHLIKSKRHVPIDRDALIRRLDVEPARHRDIWLEPR